MRKIDPSCTNFLAVLQLLRKAKPRFGDLRVPSEEILLFMLEIPFLKIYICIALSDTMAKFFFIYLTKEIPQIKILSFFTSDVQYDNVR